MTIFYRMIALGAILAALPFWPSRPAFASATVFGNGMAQICSHAARTVASNAPVDPRDLYACDTALAEESLNIRDRAGTLVNRGVLRLARGAFDDSKEDFQAAAALMPDLGEAYTNLGAALIALKRYADGIVNIDKGLGLKPEEPEKAYFNRALADEALDDMKSAYLDYSQAARLKPNWNQPRLELARFTVVQQ
jgi:tetratricopeptide (TPR) repeat protein